MADGKNFPMEVPVNDLLYGEIDPFTDDGVNRGADLHVKDGGDHVMYLHPLKEKWMRLDDSVPDSQCNSVERFARNVIYMRRRCPPRFRAAQRDIWHELSNIVGPEGWQTSMLPLLERFCIVTSMLRVFEEWEMQNAANKEAFFDLQETTQTSKHIHHRYAQRASLLAREQRQLASMLGLVHRSSFAMMDRKMLFEAMRDEVRAKAEIRRSHNDLEWNETMLPSLSEVHVAKRKDEGS